MAKTPFPLIGPAGAAMRAKHERWLLELTNTPTAAFAEDAVADYLERWGAKRPGIGLKRDRFGNLTMRRGVWRRGRPPVVIVAHMDHPAFVAESVAPSTDGKHTDVRARFRGGVMPAYFEDPANQAQAFGADGSRVKGEIVSTRKPTGKHEDRAALLRFPKRAAIQPGDVLPWALPQAAIKAGRLHAPACDNLASVAAALSVLDRLSVSKTNANQGVMVLFTRAEEVGFVGLMGAVKAKTIPASAPVVVLENSKAFAESPVGGGPIVRVGDRAATFDPKLTGAMAAVAQQMEQGKSPLKWQRRLMLGGVCEAGALCALGFPATCLCLPLMNYHNMSEPQGTGATAKHRIAPESIAIDDFHGMVRLLTGVCRLPWPWPNGEGVLRDRLEALFQARQAMLS